MCKWLAGLRLQAQAGLGEEAVHVQGRPGNPPPAYALLSTGTIAVLAIVVSGSPANAALRAASTVGQAPRPSVAEAGIALAFIAAAWALSVTAAARRG